MLRFQLEGSPRRAAGDDVDHATQAVVAVARARAVDHLDAIDALERNARPVDPAAKRIVEGHPVHEDKRAADTARPDPAQRHALRCRMRRQAAASPEQAEGRHLPEHIVGYDGRRLSNRLLFDDVRTDRDVAQRFSLRVGVTVTVSSSGASLRTTLTSLDGSTRSIRQIRRRGRSP